MCRRGRPALRLRWPLLVPLVITVPISAHYATQLDEKTLYAIAGGAIEVLVLTPLFGFRPVIQPQYRRPALFVSGILTGAVGGATSFRSAERRVGHGGVSPCRFRWSPYHANQSTEQSTC